MAGFDPSMFSGLGEDQDDLLRQEFARALRLSQPSSPRYATPGGALLGGIGDVIGAIRGGKLQSDTQAKQDALMARRKSAVEQANQPAADPFSGVAGPVTEADHARIMAEALQQREQRANAMVASGYGPLADMGKNELGTVKTERERAADAPGKRMRELLLKQQVEEGQTTAEHDNAPASQTYHQLAKKFGVSLPQGATNRTAKEVLGLAERGFSAEMRAKEFAHSRSNQAPPLTIIYGSDGAAFYADPRNPSKPVVPVVTPEGTPITKPDPDAKKKQEQLREINERSANADRVLAELEKTVTEDGTFDFTGATNSKLESFITDFATDMAKLKDPTSVARESEVEMEKKALFTPGLKGLMTGNNTALELIKNARKRVAERRKEAYRVRGLEMPAEAGEKPFKRMKDADTGEIIRVYEDGTEEVEK